MSLQNMNVYDDEIYTTTIELLGQKLDAFNAAGGGAIVLSAETFRGDYTKESFFASLASAQRRVNRNGANGSQVGTDLAQTEVVGVKIAGGFGPVVFEPSQITWLNEQPTQAIMAISEGFADAMLADQLNTAVGAAVAAVENQALLVNDVSGDSGLTQVALNGSHAKFGDMSSMLRADVMSGGAYHKLIEQGLQNGEKLFQSSNVTLVSILGKVFVVSDIPALSVTGSPDKSKVLSVVTGGIVVDNTSDIITNLETSNGKNRIETTWQADYTFGLKLKGYAWDTTAGGASPDDAALFTGSNWANVMTSPKHTLGTLAIADATI
jgi:hypothetical protein